MSIDQFRRLAPTLVFALIVPSAFGSEIVMFDGANFQGARIAFGDTLSDLDRTGFNDRAASISVRSGSWEVCTEAYFQGHCMQLQPGDYPRLDTPFNDSISSVRPLGGAVYGRDHPAPAPAPGAAAAGIVLFDGADFEGARTALGDTVPDLERTGFNDRAASISVRGGTWEVCTDAYFQGHCVELQPGDYRRLNAPFNDSISSVRPLGSAVYGGDYPAPAPPAQSSLGTGVPGVGIGINVPLYPDLIPVPGYPVYYAPQVNSNYFFYDGMYWVYQQDNWYVSSWYNGPWTFVAADAVPLFILRVPVGYYRQPPGYFRGWPSDAPPRWNEHWGNAWEQRHRGWNNWNRSSVPTPAPLPVYQRQYAGNRYPRAEQQRVLQSQNYRYQPKDAIVQQHYRRQQGALPPPGAEPPHGPTARQQR